MVYSYKSWRIPLSLDSMTVKEAFDDLRQVPVSGKSTPKPVKFVENPSYSILKRNLLVIPGAVDINTHDVIHILLGRGFLRADEAFVIGFTMGSTRKLNRFNRTFYELMATHTYPGPYKFDRVCVQIFRKAAFWGREIARYDLTEIDPEKYLNWTLRSFRHEFLDTIDDLIACYKWEQRNYGRFIECERILS